jgi:Zn-dependent M32 family carboxypeptidase
MSSFSEVEEGDIKIIHHSAASLIEVIITREQEVEQGIFEKVKEPFWFEYSSFDDLKKAINRINEIET